MSDLIEQPADSPGSEPNESESTQQLPVASSTAGSRSRPTVHREPSSVSILFLMASVLFLAAWFVGPRLVEEYHFASTKGKLRAEYENAVAILDSDPLKKVSMASRLVAHKVKPSVVSIRSTKVEEESGEARWQPEKGIMFGYGSGVIMSDDGYIVTNAHVIKNSKEIQVELHDRRRYSAIEVGRDVISDIAVLKIEASGLIPAQWGDSELLDVGSIVWAVGNPYRYDQTVTSGIISAKDRTGLEKSQRRRFERMQAGEPEYTQNLLQSDAAVNKGSSGGPLVNVEGNVVGINTSIYGDTFQGISFAVPSSTARFVYEQILSQGKVVRGFLGVQPHQVSQWQADKLNLPDLDGAILGVVQPNSPASRAGLKEFDVVRTWNGTPIRSYNSLFRMAERATPGSVVEVSLFRHGEVHTANVTIGERTVD